MYHSRLPEWCNYKRCILNYESFTFYFLQKSKRNNSEEGVKMELDKLFKKIIDIKYTVPGINMCEIIYIK